MIYMLPIHSIFPRPYPPSRQVGINEAGRGSCKRSPYIRRGEPLRWFMSPLRGLNFINSQGNLYIVTFIYFLGLARSICWRVLRMRMDGRKPLYSCTFFICTASRWQISQSDSPGVTHIIDFSGRAFGFFMPR